MITVSGLVKAFGARDLFREADLQIGARDRVALVGPNGSGKTTLLEMICGLQSPDAGDIRVAGGVTLGYLQQETDHLGGRSLLEEAVSAGASVEIGHRLEVLAGEIASLSGESERPSLLEEYGRLQLRYETLGGYSIEHEAKRVLSGLGFTPQDFDRSTEEFSGGWLMRTALAKLLLSGPDSLLLDEPTNHLDLDSVVWLERYLRSYEGAVVLISHDRDLINGTATRVIEIDNCQLISYTGDFEAFVAERELKARQVQSAARQRSREVAKAQVFINRFRYKASKARQVQSRIKALERMKALDQSPSRSRQSNLHFPKPLRSPRVVLDVRAVRFGYTEKVDVYHSLDLVLERGQKAALVGPNGAGKTTLLKLAAGVLQPVAGERRIGNGVTIGYFAQRQVEVLDPAKKVIEEFEGAIPSGVEVRSRDLLGRFLFSGNDVEKRVVVLSGGERSRLALCKVFVARPNLLCLDEPTNHLDMQSRDALEDALGEYEGAMLMITHDRHLMRSVADVIIEVVSGTVTVHQGDYDFYLSRKEPEPARPSEPPTRPGRARERRRASADSRTRSRRLRDRLLALESELEEVNAECVRLAEMLSDPDFYRSGSDVGSMVRDYDEARERAKSLESRWENAALMLEEFETGS